MAPRRYDAAANAAAPPAMVRMEERRDIEVFMDAKVQKSEMFQQKETEITKAPGRDLIHAPIQERGCVRVEGHQSQQVRKSGLVWLFRRHAQCELAAAGFQHSRAPVRVRLHLAFTFVKISLDASTTVKNTSTHAQAAY